MRFEVIVRAIIVVKGKMLFQRNLEGGELALPGGHIEKGETVKQTLIRELEEESGLKIFVGKLVYINENYFEQQGEEVHEIGFYFLASVIGDVPDEIESKEGHIDFRFVDLDEITKKEVYPTFLRSVLPEDAKNEFSGLVKHLVQKGDEEHWIE
jgi:ADP-ribose pyrophosphatase YjhB (NUDIX family)